MKNLLIGCVLALFAQGVCAGTEPSEAVVRTQQGVFAGTFADGVHAFRGIPFAQPPVGARRWRSPEPAAAHAGMRKALEFGPACPQTGADGPVDEDCLTLNVWSPGLDDAARPVMVWIHGGGFRAGSGKVPGHLFASRGITLVSLNYRLGPLGFFAHPSLGGDVANFGLQDMVLALEWVRDNIAAFGGDPGRVTVFGLSAGGMAVSLLLASDAAQGLLHGAIAQSGYGTWALPRTANAPMPAPLGMDLKPAPSAEALARQLIDRVSSDAGTAAELRALDAMALMEAVQGFHLPVVDGVTLREEPGILFLAGKQHDVPVITGGTSFDGSVMPYSGISEQAYQRLWGADYLAVKGLYAEDFASDPKVGIARLFGDNRYLLAARTLGLGMGRRQSPAWLYYLDLPVAEPLDDSPGTPHGYDGRLLFAGATLPDAGQRALSERLIAYWLDFARTGDPNGGNRLQWPDYRAGDDRWLVFGIDDEIRPGIARKRLDYIDARYRARIEGAGNQPVNTGGSHPAGSRAETLGTTVPRPLPR